MLLNGKNLEVLKTQISVSLQNTICEVHQMPMNSLQRCIWNLAGRTDPTSVLAPVPPLQKRLPLQNYWCMSTRNKIFHISQSGITPPLKSIQIFRKYKSLKLNQYWYKPVCTMTVTIVNYNILYYTAWRLIKWSSSI